MNGEGGGMVGVVDLSVAVGITSVILEMEGDWQQCEWLV
jgi:hypothetical protein